MVAHVSFNQSARKMEQGQLWRQYIIAGVANLGIACVGYCMGWSSPVNVKLLDANQSPLPTTLTGSQASWIGSLLNIGGIIGPFIAGYLAARIGRKWTVISGAIPLLIGWILIGVANAVGLIYAGRVFWGIGAGMLFTVTPMYCAEIATVDCRGALGSFLQVFITIGFLMIYVVGPFVSYDVIAYVGVITVGVFVICCFFTPESPMYYLMKDDKEAAAKSLMVLRGRSRAGVETEVVLLEADAKASIEKTGTIADIFHGSNFKAFYISCGLVFFQQLCGINAVLFYMNTIFDDAGSRLDPAVATIIIGAVQAGAALCTPLVVDRLGRKILLLVSCAGTAICHIFLGLYFLLDAHHSPMAKSLDFLPVTSLVVFVLVFNWGLGPITWALMNEIFPIEVKTVASPIATAFCWVLSFLTTRYFEPVAAAVGMYTAFWVFGVSCALGFLFTLFVVPETKGKSFADIQEMLARGSRSYKSHQQKEIKESEWVPVGDLNYRGN